MAAANAERVERFKRLVEDYGEVEYVDTGVMPHFQVTVPNWISTKNIPLNFEGVEVKVFSMPPTVPSVPDGTKAPRAKDVLPLVKNTQTTLEEVLVDEPLNVLTPKKESPVDTAFSTAIAQAQGSGGEILTESEFNRIAKLYPAGLGEKANIKGIQNASVDSVISSVISFVAAGGNFLLFKEALASRLKRYERMP